MRRARRWPLVALLALGALLRVGYAGYQHRPVENRPAGYWDPEDYDAMGQRWLATGSFSDVYGAPKTDREPFYPLLLGAAHAVFGPSYLVAVALNLLFSTLCCWLIYALTLELFQDRAAALWACGMAAVYPEWIYWSVFAYREPMLTLLSLAWLLLWARAAREPRPAHFAAMGLIFGALCVTRSPMIPLGGAFALLAAWSLRPRIWHKTVGVFLICAALVNGAWVLRNYRVTGRLVPGATMGGLMMYMGLIKDYDRPEEALEHNLRAADEGLRERVRAAGGTGPAADAEYYRASKDIFRNEPRRFWTAFARKCMKLWQPYPSRGWSYDHRYALLKWIGLLSNVPLMLLALAGAVLALRRRAPIGFMLAIPAVMTLVYGMFWAVTRYRAPLMVSVIPLAALAAAAAWSRFSRIQP